MDEWEIRVGRVAKEIEQYLKTHPEAADSLEGIATWWLPRQRIRSEIAVLEAALEKLTDSGVVVMARHGKYGPLYRLKERGR